jgi:hypothetical protein
MAKYFYPASLNLERIAIEYDQKPEIPVRAITEDRPYRAKDIGILKTSIIPCIQQSRC